MTGVPLSRWTMFYFAAALIALLAAEIMMATGFGFSGSGACRAPDPRSSVAIGWLSLLMCGALLQFLPVLVAQPLYSNALALPALVSLVAGLAALILGFLQLGGRLDPDIPYFATGAIPQGVRQPHLLLSPRSLIERGENTMGVSFVELDVRPILRAGGEPFEEIMGAVAKLEPGQGLRLLATFKPIPLFGVLGARGFSHEVRELAGGDWEVLFGPCTPEPIPTSPAPAEIDGPDWSAPVQHMDNRELDPPEPMVRILAATESLKEGEVLSALLCREPIFLFPELAKRGHAWRGGFESDGTTYRILVRIGGPRKAAA